MKKRSELAEAVEALQRARKWRAEARTRLRTAQTELAAAEREVRRTARIAAGMK